jgi:mono/diheme cytochrome c family protein
MRIKLIIGIGVFALGLMAASRSGALTDGQQPSGGPLDPAGEGRRVFLENNCYGCHGGRGGGGMGPNLRGGLDIKVEDAVHGLPGGMPRFRNLTDTDVSNLKAYFATLRTPAEPTFTHWWEPIPTQ